MKYNPNIHHRQSIRLKGYDYSQTGAYFVTLCVQNHECLFGKIISGKMQLNDFGRVIYNYWEQINIKYPHVEPGHFIVMPNHFHGIIVINEYYGDGCDRGENRDGDRDFGRGEVTSPLPTRQTPQPPTLGQIVAWFKYQSTKHINQLRRTPGIKLWQRNYYEHIIRNQNEYVRIIKYISNNPEF